MLAAAGMRRQPGSPREAVARSPSKAVDAEDAEDATPAG